MSDNVIVEFVGFEAKALVREYNFHVRQASSEIREFTPTIVNEAFNSRRVRYQDAPEICSLRLHRELATYSNRPPQAHYRISELDLDEYRNSTHQRRRATLISPSLPKAYSAVTRLGSARATPHRCRFWDRIKEMTGLKKRVSIVQ